MNYNLNHFGAGLKAWQIKEQSVLYYIILLVTHKIVAFLILIVQMYFNQKTLFEKGDRLKQCK